MCVPLADVRDVSITGEFDAPAVTDTMIERALKRVCTRWRSVKEWDEELWSQIVRHHAAHLLHLAKKSEGGGKGPVVSESLAQVGSRTYAQPTVEGEFGVHSPYLPELLGYIESLPPSIRALTGEV